MKVIRQAAVMYKDKHFFNNIVNVLMKRYTSGIARAKAKIGMMNLTYNICQCVQLKIEVSMG